MLAVIIGSMQLLTALTGRSFEFHGVTAGVEVPHESVKRCEAKGDTLWCVKPGDAIAGVQVGSTMVFRGNTLAALLLKSDRSNFYLLDRVFRIKYGAPCETREDRWRNAGGADLPNPVLVWCFATGKLTLSQYGRRIERLEAIYLDEANKPPFAADVDF